MMENGETRDDLTLPGGTDEYDKLAKQLKEDFAEGKEIIVTVLKVGISSMHGEPPSATLLMCLPC